jgi:hypothetical protein
VLLHEPVDPLGVDGIVAGGSPLALEERANPPVSIARPAIHQAPDIGSELCVPGAGLGTALRTFAGRSLNQVGPPRASLRSVSPGILRRQRSRQQGRIFTRARSSASLRISTSMVLRPSRRSRSRTRYSSRRTSEAATTSAARQSG